MSKPRHHRLIRFVSVLTLAGSVAYMADRSEVRSDLSAEGLSEISEHTRDLAGSVSTERPVVVNAYLSPEVPRAYVGTRTRLLNVLRELKASAGPGLSVNIHEPAVYSELAQQAEDAFGIAPREVFSNEGGRVEKRPVFLGVAMTSGPREEVIAFFEPGLSVEYELARALELVGSKHKPVAGILKTDARIMGDFDPQSGRQRPAWRIVDELRKQYEVRSLNPSAAVPEDVDVLLVPQLSSLQEAELAHLRSYLEAGRPAMLVADPMPALDIRLAPSEPLLAGAPQMGMGGLGGAPSSASKGDYHALLASLGVRWDDQRIVYDLDNPNPQFASVPPYIVFSGPRQGHNSFAGGDPIVDGLDQVVTLFPGSLQAVEGATTSLTPLLQTGARAGSDRFADMVDRSNPFFGVRGPTLPGRLGPLFGAEQTLATLVRGGDKDYRAIVLADLDMFADDFFVLHERGGDRDGDGLIDERFDNVTFLLNCLDSLTDNPQAIELRKRQPHFRRLAEVEAYTKSANEERQARIDEANAEADEQLAEAQAALDTAVAKIEARGDLDDTAKAILKRSAQEAEQRRLDLRSAAIERDKARALARVEAEHMRAVDAVRDRIRVASLLFPPIPALALGLFILFRKRRREHATIPADRKRGTK